MKRGKCPMCFNEKEIIESHLMPSALYGLCDAPDAGAVLVSSKLILMGARELKHPLLCDDCDNGLSTEGESWLLPLLAKIDGTFPFYDILVKVPPDAVKGDSALYAAAKNPGIESEKLIHFAMGIFWKASIHSWRKGVSESMIDLGKYGASVRTFLRGETPFPNRMALTVGVSPPPLQPTFCMPYRGSANDVHNFLFHVPGINFALNVGNLVTEDMKEAALSSNKQRPILLKNLAGENLKIAKEASANAHKAANVLKYIKESKALAEYLQKRAGK